MGLKRSKHFQVGLSHAAGVSEKVRGGGRIAQQASFCSSLVPALGVVRKLWEKWVGEVKRQELLE